MADTRFFQRSEPKTLQELARHCGAEVSEGANPDQVIDDVAPLDRAGPSHIAFFENKKYKEDFRETKAGACIVAPDHADAAPEGLALLLTPSPYKAYARVAALFYPEAWPDPGVANSASIDKSAILGDDCVIGHGVVIEAGAQIGNHCWIEHGAVIGKNVSIGDHCRIGANAVISHALIGSHVRLYPGARIGQDGFGFAIDPQGHVKVPQLGRVIIEDHCEIGANTCIDRGAGPDTVIGQGTWIDNLVQIGHNVKIGKGCILVSQVGISGSTELGDFAVLGGQAGVAGHLKIGGGARIAAQSGIMRDVEPKAELMGSPAVPLKQFMRQVAFLSKMVNKK